MPCPVLDILRSINDFCASRELSRLVAGQLPKGDHHSLLISS